MNTRLFLALAALSASAASEAASPSAASATLVAEGWRHRVWSLYPIEKLKADETLPAKPRAERVQLDVAQGERESFILVVRSDVPLRDIAVTAGQFRSGASTAALAVAVAPLGYVYVSEPSGTRIKTPMPYPTGTGEYPDPLLSGSCNVRPGRNAQLLVTVDVPRPTKADRYETTLTVHYRHEDWMPSDSAPETVVTLSVRVRDFALPEVTPLLNTCVASWNALPAWLNRSDVLADLRRTFAAAGQAPDPLPPPVLRRERDGSLTIDSAAWEHAAAELLEHDKVSHLFLPVWTGQTNAPMQGVYFLWHYPAVTKQRWLGATICNPDGSLTAEFKALFGTYLKHMHALLRRRGWLHRVYITTMDEPYTYHLHDARHKQETPENNYRVIGHYVRFIRETAPGLRTCATADPAPGLNGLIDLWCLRNLEHAPEARERAAKFGERVTFCDNYRTFIDFPAVSARSLGWLVWKLGASGWLTYETLGGLTTAWEGLCFVYPHFSGGSVWGMGQMFYPDPRGAGRLAPSLRWELMREGSEDYAYLWLLRERLNGLPVELKSSATALEAATLLASAADAVVGGAGDAETESTAVTPNAASSLVPHELRRRLAGLIERLQAN